MTDLIIKPKPGKIDKRTKNGKKLDLSEVIKLKDVNNLSYAKIAKQLGYSTGYIHNAYSKFKDLVQDTDTSKNFIDNRVAILSTLELGMLQDLNDEGKRSKASLNNTAYAYNVINTNRRLEEGKGTAGGVTVNIEIAYQEATELSRKVRLKHAGTGSTSDIPDEVA
jgi:prophage DNA circulation protein